MKDNQALKRYELQVDGYIAYANYRLDKGVINIDYVFAPPELRGSGAAGKLMAEIVKMAQERGVKIHPICGYAVAWLKKHDEFEGLVA